MLIITGNNGEERKFHKFAITILDTDENQEYEFCYLISYSGSPWIEKNGKVVDKMAIYAFVYDTFWPELKLEQIRKEE